MAFFFFFILNTFDPTTVGPFGIVAVFCVWYLFWVSTLFVGLHYGVKFAMRLWAKKNGNLDMRVRSVGIKRAYYIASILAFAPVILVAMRSFAQLRLIDIALVVLVMGMMVFYVVKRVK